jgi:DNA-binding transcriptional LysR family regulator
VELRQLGYFVAVAEERNFTRAAERLLVAQPAVSRQVRLLERELGAQLFERTPRDVLLTDAGEALLPRARDALAAVDSGRAEVAAAAGVLRGALTIGCLFGAPRLEIAALLSSFHRDYPSIEVALTQDLSERLLDCVRSGECDAAFVSLAPGPVPPGLTSETVDRERAMLIVPSDHELATRDHITMAELSGEPFIALAPGTGHRTMIETACREAGFAPDIVLSVQNVITLADLAAEGLGVTFVPETIVPTSDGVCAIPVADPLLQRTVRMVWRAEDHPGPTVQAFLDLAREHFDRVDTSPREPWTARR